MDDGDADACDGADVEIRIKLPTGMVMHTYISPKDTLLDARQILSECIESCYITCYELIRANGTAMSNFDVFGDVAKGELFTVRFRKYDEKDMRFHVAHLQELLMARLDDVMVSVYPTFPYDDPDGQTQKAYPSISRILGPNLKAIADTDSDSSFQAAVHTVDYALDPTCEHATGFTFSKEKKIAEQIYMKRTQHQELPPLGNFACAEDFDKEVTLDGVYDMLDQVPPVKHAVVPQISLQWNGFNPPPRHRKLQGDLGYVDVQFVGGHTSQVTCTPSGFYVNQSKSKADFSPGPAAKPHHSETLLGLLFTLNPKFREKACDLIRTRASIHPFETGPLAMPSLSNWMEHPESRVLPTGLISARCGEGSPAVLDHHTPVRSWNDEFQKAHDMPVDTYARRLEREKALARLHTEFLDFSMRAGVTAADGQMAPINPQEHPSSWVYLINNIFISQALDTRKVYTEVGGDKASQFFVKHDLQGIAAIRATTTKLSTVSTAVFDYKGKRIVCQTLVPGIIMNDIDGKIASPQVHGCGEESGGKYLEEPKIAEDLEQLSRSLCLMPHKMKDALGNEVRVQLNAEVKVMRSCDGRYYLLECSKTTPRDLNWPDNKLAYIRPELKAAYIKMKRIEKNGPKVEAIRQQLRQYASRGMPPVQLHLVATELIRDLDSEDPPVLFNCDYDGYSPDLFPPDSQEEADKGVDVLKDVAAYLKATKLPLARKEIVDTAIDTEGLAPILRKHGVNMRYLGEICDTLPAYAVAAKKLCITEMVARVVKHKVRAVMFEHAAGDIATPVAALLNAVLGEAASDQPLGKHQQQQQQKAAKAAKKALKKQQQQQQQQGQPESHQQPGAERPAAAAAGAVPRAPLADLLPEVAAGVKAKYRFDLAERWMAGISKFVLLRSVCLKTGLTVRQRAYDFASRDPFEPGDILDAMPIVHQRPPNFTAIEKVLDPSTDELSWHQNEELEDVVRRCHHALNHVSAVIGAVCIESGHCYRALARVLLAVKDVDIAVQHQYKAMTIFRRSHGPVWGAMVPLYRTMAVMAHHSGRLQPALLYLVRAVYLSRVLSGDVPYDLLFALVSFYQEVGHPDRAEAVLAFAFKKAEAHRTGDAGDPASAVALATCHQHRAMILGQQGRHAAAVDAQKKAVTLFTDTLGSADARTKEADTWYCFWVKTAVDKAKKIEKAKR